MKIENLLTYLKCPYCDNQLLILKEQRIVCFKCQTNFMVLSGVPVMMDLERLNEQEKNQIKKFDKHYRKNSTDYKLENWQQSILQRMFAHVSTPQFKTYLDIGCADNGYTVIEAAKRNDWLAFGINISPKAVLKAKDLADKQGVAEKTGFVIASAENLPFQNNTFDYISMLSVLEHIENDWRVIQTLDYILKIKGEIYLCLPNSYKNIYTFLKPIYYFIDQSVGHQRHYSLEELNEKMKNFKLEKYFYNGHLIKLWQIILEKLHLIGDRKWWQMEEKDINDNPKGLQLNALYKKNE